jgi:hypothetical protein
MNKKILYFFVFASLLCLAKFALADGITPPAGIPDNFKALLTNIATGVGTAIASLSVIMFIVAGGMYLFSAGNPGRMETAKKALIYAIIGIVIGSGASGIVAYIGTLIK